MCPPCGSFTSTTSKSTGRPPLTCAVCGQYHAPAGPYGKRFAAHDNQGGSLCRHRTEYSHCDGEACRPPSITSTTIRTDCFNCDTSAVFDLSRQGENFVFARDVFLSRGRTSSTPLLNTCNRTSCACAHPPCIALSVPLLGQTPSSCVHYFSVIQCVVDYSQTVVQRVKLYFLL